jgi:hypothetical protein
MAVRSTPKPKPARAPAARKATAEKPSPLVLTGPPHAVRGRITLANGGSDRLVIRGAVIHLPEREPVAVPLTALIGPGVTTEAVVSADLGGGWPAGTVLGELEVNGQRRAVEVRVTPTIGVTITPAEALATEGVTRLDVVVHNVGNVAVPLARVTRGHLVAHDNDEPRESGDPHVDQADATLRLAKSVTLQPGQEVPMQVVVEIPKGLPADRRHRARLPVGTADLVVIVLPTDPPTAPASKPRSRTTTRKES